MRTNNDGQAVCANLQASPRATSNGYVYQSVRVGRGCPSSKCRHSAWREGPGSDELSVHSLPRGLRVPWRGAGRRAISSAW